MGRQPLDHLFNSKLLTCVLSGEGPCWAGGGEGGPDCWGSLGAAPAPETGPCAAWHTPLGPPSSWEDRQLTVRQAPWVSHGPIFSTPSLTIYVKSLRNSFLLVACRMLPEGSSSRYDFSPAPCGSRSASAKKPLNHWAHVAGSLAQVIPPPPPRPAPHSAPQVLVASEVSVNLLARGWTTAFLLGLLSFRGKRGGMASRAQTPASCSSVKRVPLGQC